MVEPGDISLMPPINPPAINLSLKCSKMSSSHHGCQRELIMFLEHKA